MYLPKLFAADQSASLELMDRFPFATVLSADENGAPFVNHVPVLTESAGGKVTVTGHMSKRNPQWMHFKANPAATVVFQGPQAYITPTWYRSGRDVPTWNYAAVHATGTAVLIEDFESLKQILKKLTHRFEKGRPQPWEFELPEDLLDPAALTGAIIGFQITVEKMEGKYKLSQNRSKEDREGVRQGLESQQDQGSQMMYEMMTQAEERR
jgi:transcriptional regulator